MRACPACGAYLTAGAAPNVLTLQNVAPWAALGVAMLALVVAVAALMDRGGGAPAPPPASPSFSAAPAGAGEPPDLSTMTPREAADRLFNRIMAASEGGDTAQASQFIPMALAAYQRLGTLDNDAHYHLGLIHLTAGDIKSARAQLDQIQRSNPKHLLGIMLAYHIAERDGDQAGEARAYKAFLAAYDAEAAAGRPEYQHHWSSIERFRTAAQARTAGKG